MTEVLSLSYLSSGNPIGLSKSCSGNITCLSGMIFCISLENHHKNGTNAIEVVALKTRLMTALPITGAERNHNTSKVNHIYG
jgi:hypothetical protein